MSEMFPEIRADQLHGPDTTDYYVDPVTQPDEPAILQLSELSQEESLRASVRFVVAAASEKLSVAGIQLQSETVAKPARLRNLGRSVVNRFTAQEPPKSELVVHTARLYDPYDASLTLLGARLWTDGVGQRPSQITVADVSRGHGTRQQTGGVRQRLVLDPRTFELLEATTQANTLISPVPSPIPRDPSNLTHLGNSIMRSHLIEPDVYKATQADGLTPDDVRRIVGIEWQPPEPPKPPES